TWTSLGRDAAAASQRVNVATALGPQGSSSSSSTAASAAGAMGGPFYPVRVDMARRAQPLDLSSFLRPDVRR
ncbi:hypothetical protein OSI40_25320, partial [Mycobacterium ulcerans]